MSYPLKPISPQRGDFALVLVGAAVLAVMFSGPITSLFAKNEVEPVIEPEPQVELEVLGPVNDGCAELNTVCSGEEEPDVKDRIVEQAVKYGVDPKAALWIADCESDFRPLARNQISNTMGIFQWKLETWEYIKAPSHPYDVGENIHQFMIHYPKNPQWWECSYPY